MAAQTLSTSRNPFMISQPTENISQSSSSAPAVRVPPERSGTLLSEGLPDDAPPAYTPSANSQDGEASVEFGPRRPFQQAPPVAVSAVSQPTGGSRQSPTPPQSLAPVFSPPPGRPPPRHPAAVAAAARTQTYAPPPGRPPRSRRRSHSPPQCLAPPDQPSRRSASTSHPDANPGVIPDDGRPTTTPVPDHPLLRDGRLLVYPTGYECPKCKNTGFKNYDPSHPCRKCWDRYAKPYSGALPYAPAASSTSPTGNFQRPLPNFKPPHLRARSENYAASVPAPVPPVRHAPPPATLVAPSFGPPPGATVVLPGDPRIGGRLCWRCDGRGSVSFLFFDQETCIVCRGIGRVFN